MTGQKTRRLNQSRRYHRQLTVNEQRASLTVRLTAEQEAGLERLKRDAALRAAFSILFRK